MVGIFRSPLHPSSLRSSGLDEPLVPKESRATDSLSWDLHDVSCIGDEDLVNLHTGSISAKDVAVAGATAILVVGGIAASAFSMVAVPSVIVYVAGGICILNSRSVAKRQMEITRGKGILRSIYSLRTEADMLKLENDFIHGLVHDLKSEVSNLGTLERKLQFIASKQQKNVNDIVYLVKENEELLNRIKNNLRQCIVSEMVKIVVTSDRNRDMKADIGNLPNITLRLRIQLDAHGVSLDTRRFEDFISKNNVLQFCNTLFYDHHDEEDGGKDDDTNVSFDFDDIFDEDEEKEEKLKMFSIDKKYTNGSVEVARGKRMTVVENRNTRRKTMVKDITKRLTRMRENRKLRMIVLGGD